jgi:hypothetical protein
MSLENRMKCPKYNDEGLVNKAVIIVSVEPKQEGMYQWTSKPGLHHNYIYLLENNWGKPIWGLTVTLQKGKQASIPELQSTRDQFLQ